MESLSYSLVIKSGTVLYTFLDHRLSIVLTHNEGAQNLFVKSLREMAGKRELGGGGGGREKRCFKTAEFHSFLLCKTSLQSVE